MSLLDRLKPVLKVLKIVSLCGGTVIIVAYHFREVEKIINNIVNTKVLNVEKKFNAEYIYIEDPSYDATMKVERSREISNSVGFGRIWKSLKHSWAWKLLWVCRHGNKEQRNVAIEQLAAFKNNKIWDCQRIAQALDRNTAVLLAHTQGVDLRYFLPPPINVRRAASTSHLLSYQFKDMISSVQIINPHSCIQHFLSKYFVNLQEQIGEVDGSPPKPDNLTEKELCILCLDALHHHIFLFNQFSYEKDKSAQMLIKMGILPKLAELIIRNKNDSDIDFAVLKVLTVFSLYTELLDEFFKNGIIGELARLLKSHDIRLASSAAVCLANLSGDFCYRPGLFLLYPLYRKRTTHTCDTLLVHGLRGGVFVTWRQRDKKCAEPVGIIEVTISDVDCEPCQESISKDKNSYLDPELEMVLEELKELEDESLLSNFDVVLNDIPIEAKRDASNEILVAKKKRLALLEEEEDKCNHTYCWPKDWLPKDCSNIRILGFNYWSKLSDWLEGCPLQSADINARAEELALALVDAKVGTKNVIWLAHSMGGLIVKQLLVNSAEQSDEALKKLCQKTKAVIFYSTPHRGSSLATMPRTAASILWPSQDVKQLQENSPELLKLHNSFLNYAETFNWETISFAETLPTLITAFKVPVHFVEPYSADLGRGAFYQLPLDHLSICKPATRQSILYRSVLDSLQQATVCEVETGYSESYMYRLAARCWLCFSKFIKQVKSTLYE